MTSFNITALDKQRCAERELKKRLHVYPKLVGAGTMTQALADREIAIMQAIAEDYRREASREDLFGGAAS